VLACPPQTMTRFDLQTSPPPKYHPTCIRRSKTNVVVSASMSANRTLGFVFHMCHRVPNCLRIECIQLWKCPQDLSISVVYVNVHAEAPARKHHRDLPAPFGVAVSLLGNRSACDVCVPDVRMANRQRFYGPLSRLLSATVETAVCHSPGPRLNHSQRTRVARCLAQRKRRPQMSVLRRTENCVQPLAHEARRETAQRLK